MKVSVVIPAYNEEEAIGATVAKIKSLYPDFEILVIDDGSAYATAKKAREAGAIVFQHPYNMGNGAAVKRGIRMASGDVIVLMDGDGQHNPEDIKRLLKESAKYDLVVGSREGISHASWARRIANMAYNALARYVTNFPVKDLTSGFRVFHRETVMKFLYLFPNSFSYPTTSTLAYLRSGYLVKYVPITAGKRRGASKIHIFSDGIRFFLVILKIATLFSPLRIFLPVSCLFGFTGLGYYLYTYINYNRFTNMSALLLSVSIMIFLLGMISEQITMLRYHHSTQDQ